MAPKYNAVRVGPRDRSNDRNRKPQPKPKRSDVPEGMTVEQTVDWVSGDWRRAKAALAYEQATDAPRSSLVLSLSRLAANEPPVGAADGPNANAGAGETEG